MTFFRLLFTTIVTLSIPLKLTADGAPPSINFPPLLHDIFAVNLIGPEALYARRDYSRWQEIVRELDKDAPIALYRSEIRPYSAEEIRNADCGMFTLISFNKFTALVESVEATGQPIAIGWNHVFTPVSVAVSLNGNTDQINEFVAAVGVADKSLDVSEVIDPVSNKIHETTKMEVRRSTPRYEELFSWGIDNLEIRISHISDCEFYELILVEGTMR